MTDVTPSADGAWPLPSGAPALPVGAPVVATPELPVPYARPVPPRPDTEGEPELVAAAHVAVHEQRFTDAVDLLEEFLRAHPEDARAWHRLAGARIGLGQYRTALAAADRSVELDPARAPAHLMRGLAQGYLHGWGSAEPSAARAVELDPGSADAHALLAQALSAQGRAGAAEDAARAALAIAPGHRAALLVLAKGGSPVARWMPVVNAVAMPVVIVLGVLTLMLAGSPEAAIFGGFAVVAVLPLFTAVLRWALGSRGGVVRALPGWAFPVIPVAATAFVAVPVLLTGTRLAGAVALLLITGLFATSCTMGLRRSIRRRAVT
ncbi:tetratricopeptide repeat protein [Actinoplanes sp. L3-i22]|uniref:tetratricopeptide repeat protein n=1 Tax=Actinoplanes sp. L3-i22 TaxID=2836373 RepID=UPI001C74E906|nr:tetratricopeptide repeat protein [Actinoplanes sp. L3-i22]BCY14622.1 hypothetical protein L3i22_097100 [Actinoplanes sp. L3-i22]